MMYNTIKSKVNSLAVRSNFLQKKLPEKNSFFEFGDILCQTQCIGMEVREDLP